MCMQYRCSDIYTTAYDNSEQKLDKTEKIYSVYPTVYIC